MERYDFTVNANVVGNVPEELDRLTNKEIVAVHDAIQRIRKLSLTFTRLWKVHKNEPFKDVQTLSQECCLPKSDVFSSSNPQSGIIMNESIIYDTSFYHKT